MKKRTGSFLNQSEGASVCTTNRSEPEVDGCAVSECCSRMKTLEKIIRSGGDPVVKVPNNQHKVTTLKRIEDYKKTEHESECSGCRFRYNPSSK